MIEARFGGTVHGASRASASRVPKVRPLNWDTLQRRELRAKQWMG